MIKINNQPNQGTEARELQYLGSSSFGLNGRAFTTLQLIFWQQNEL
uniref:Uncharacterized protein n=1 Tax=Nelumbo nucifera TaxID=4432 RepID=A0A822ZPG7_NELNU|nr:TPA_asm: hypothetical protein HUJ06_016724 [Nelumbo nucifera]